MKHEKKISLCMIIKNEEKNLHRCLQSLTPIIESELGELIIVDTGSEDSSLDIARQYTDKVYEHTWTNNFSEMRNISISYANGEWIWIIDADEEIENPDEMVELFKKDLSTYNTVIIQLKNYMATPNPNSEEIYNLCSAKRGFRNTKTFRFEGAVHNQPISEAPYYISNIKLKHYGYIWEDKEFARKKFERTTSILEEELKKNPNDIYYQFQLATSWSNIDSKVALIEIRKAYDLIQRLPKNRRGLYLYVFIIYARIANGNNKHLECIEICKEGLGYSKDLIDLRYLAGISYMGLNDYEKALQYLKEYIELKKCFFNTKVSKDSSLNFYHLDNFSENLALYNIAIILIDKKDYDSANVYISNMYNGNFKTDIITKISVTKDEYSYLLSYLEEIYSDTTIRGKFIFDIENKIFNKHNNKELISKLLDIYELEGLESDPYYLLTKVRNSIHTNMQLSADLFERIVELEYNSLPNCYGDIVYYVIKHNIDLVELKNIGRLEDLQSKLKYAMNKYEEFYDDLLKYMKNYHSVEDVNSISYWIIFARYILLKEGSNFLCQQEYLELFNKYVDLGGKYITHIYTSSIINNELVYHMHSDEHRFFLFLLKANEIKYKDKKLYIQYLNKAVKIYPMVKGIEGLLDLIKEEESESTGEMNLLKKQFKDNIKLLIESSMFVQAEALIKQYEQIAADDIDILLFKSQISVLKLGDTDNKIIN